MQGFLNRVRSTIDMSELRNIMLKRVVTNLNAYKRNMFIRVLLTTIVLIVHIIIDKWPLLLWINTAITFRFPLPHILEHFVQFAIKCSAAKFSILFDHFGNRIEFFQALARPPASTFTFCDLVRLASNSGKRVSGHLDRSEYILC
jgi:hypothetical protein